MTVNRTTLLDLPLPVTGTESGTWGDTTNNGLTQYLDIAIAGTLVLSTDADVTLTSTEGDSSATNIGATTAQYAILRWTATGSTTRNITALAQSKTYVVINATGGTQSIVLRGAGPTTGVTIISGEKALCVWNGSDFVKVSSSAAAGGSNTQVQYNSSGVLAGSSNLTFDGTSLTLGGNPTLSAGTANGVLYLNGSKVATSGSALTWDGSSFATTGDVVINNAKYYYGKNAAGSTVRLLGVNAGNVNYVGSIDSGPTEVNYGAATTITAQYWNVGGSEQMRLTSTGLGIGTSSPSDVLTLAGGASGSYGLTINNSKVGGGTKAIFQYDATNAIALVGGNTTNGLAFQTLTSGNLTTKATLDSSGNLGLGVTPNWNTYTSVLQLPAGGIGSYTPNLDLSITQNAYYNSGWKYSGTGAANRLNVQNGAFNFYTAPSGTAGNAITFTQAMTLDSSGRLGIGVTSPATKLQVNVASDTSIHCYSPSAAVAQIAALNDAGNSSKQLNLDGSPLVFGVEGVERARINSSGNLGLGVTPSAWSATYKALQVGAGGSFSTGSSLITYAAIGANYFDDGASRYLGTGAATLYAQNAGQHIWYNAPSGTAGNAITFTQAMTLDAAGALLVGMTSRPNDARIASSGPIYVDAAPYGIGNFAVSSYAATSVFANSGYGSSAISFGRYNGSGTYTSQVLIDPSGNLGLGTTSPSLASGMGIAVYNSTVGGAARIALKNGSTGDGSGDGFQLVASGVDAYIEQRENGFLAFTTNNTERARITSGGDFQLGTGGTASENVRSLINGSSTTGYGGYIEFQNNGSAFAAVGDYKALGGGGSTALLLCKNSTGGVYLATSGATSWSAVSDENKKNIIENISDAAAKVSSLRAVIGTYKDDPNAERHPFLIAQDVQAVLPEAVTDNEGVLGLSYSDVIPLLVAAIKEQQALITSLTARVALLEGN